MRDRLVDKNKSHRSYMYESSYVQTRCTRLTKEGKTIASMAFFISIKQNNCKQVQVGENHGISTIGPTPKSDIELGTGAGNFSCNHINKLYYDV